MIKQLSNDFSWLIKLWFEFFYILGGGFGCDGSTKYNIFCGFALSTDGVVAAPKNIPICGKNKMSGCKVLTPKKVC